MEIGKLSNDALDKVVISNVINKRKEVLVGSGIGEDNAVIDFGEDVCVVSTDPITGASKGIGGLAIHISCNDVAASGAEALGVLITILAPEGTRLEEIDDIMKEAGQVSKELDIEIIGGHTEITNAVNRIVISSTVIGKHKKRLLPKKENIKVGDRVLITKHAGIEGTSILAKERENFLKSKMSAKEIKKAQDEDKYLSVVKEGRIASNIGVNYMHDITEGGVLGAVWEASKAIDKGICIKEDLIPVKDITKKLTDILELDVYKLISSGSMLIISSQENVKILEKELNKEDIKITEIGKVVEEGTTIEREGEKIEISPPGTDELYKALKF